MTEDLHDDSKRLEIANRVDEVRRLVHDEHDPDEIAKAEEDLAAVLREVQKPATSSQTTE